MSRLGNGEAVYISAQVASSKYTPIAFFLAIMNVWLRPVHFLF